MAFNLASCPTGWSPLATAEGRVIAGLPSGGTLGATVGTALSNQENRAVGQHSHTTQNAGSHGHSYTRYGALEYRSGPGCSSCRQWQGTGSGTSGSNGVHGHTINNAGSIAGTPAPYIQFLYCQKD